MLTIGDLAKETGVAAQTVRHYEAIGLISKSLRTEGNQRRYDKTHLESLGFIKHARELGFSLEDIRELIDLERKNEEADCKTVTKIVSRHLLNVKERIKALKSLEKEMTRMLEACPHSKLEDCKILQTLHDFQHSRCLSHEHEASGIKSLPKRKA